MNYKITGVVRLLMFAGKAAPSPNIASVLGPRGVNMMKFCSEFNDITKNYEEGILLRVLLKIKSNKSFEIVLKGISVSNMLRKEFSIDKGSNAPGKEIIKTIKRDDLLALARDKFDYMNCNNIESALNMICGTAHSMGIRVVN
ncbi:50S ribosomal protein L11 [Anaplasmataceae bacterium AB001_6]|nr:50S ribosomal protein L11 [Anaplasmataceae bacterium AB001_6]